MIEVQGLNKFYGMHHALKHLSFQVEPHEILGFLGPNGAGKTTTLQILTGFLAASTGTVKINGYDIVHDAQKAREQIGYLPESVPLYPDQTPLQYLSFRAKLKGLPFRKRKERLEDVLEKCELGKVRSKKIFELSKGYRQRVGLADALLANPPVLLLDEPTVGLDPLQKIALSSLIKELKEEHTILFSTHILPEASSLCSKILILNQGKRLAFNDPEKLMHYLYGGCIKYRAVIQGTESLIMHDLEPLEGIEKVEWVPGERYHYDIWCLATSDPRKAIFETCVQKGYLLLELYPQKETLEDLFVTLLKRQEEDESESVA